MAFGKLGSAVLVAATDTTIYTVPLNCKYAVITLDVLNSESTDASVEVALSASGTPVNGDYIERSAILSALGGILNRTDITLSPGENVIVKSSLAGLNVRVSGLEVI